MTNLTYAELGWTRHFATRADADTLHPLRVSHVHRNGVTAHSPEGPQRLDTPDTLPQLAVGDWVTAENGAVTALLDRETLLKRRAPGEDAREQVIAANVTTMAITSSCNADFNIRRLERYLVLAAETGCLPLILLTKADQCNDPEAYVKEAEALSPMVTALAIDATDPLEIKRLHPWCRAGDTLALVGSSGVGKTTIRNALTDDQAATQGIREDDAHGRHTTTSRAMLRTHAGGWLIDTPGMRALRLFDATEGIETIFADIEDLTHACRFRDCAHDTEPGCAVRAAVETGALTADRLARWQKLKAEDIRNSETLAQARARDKGFGKMVKRAMAEKEGRKGKG